MKKLIKGIVEFRRTSRPGYKETFAKLALGQSPDALLIACSDSRMAVNVFASTEPGDVFVVRNVGNMVAACDDQGTTLGDESEAAALEFATRALSVSDIIICGHSECGAMRALLSDERTLDAPHLYRWLRHAEGALEKLRAGARMKDELALHNHLSQLNVLEQMEHVSSYPSVRERIAAGKLDVHGWWFDIARANVMAYEKEEDRFVVIDEAEAERILARLDAS